MQQGLAAVRITALESMLLGHFSSKVRFLGLGGRGWLLGDQKIIGGDNLGEIRMAYLAYRILAKRGDFEIRKIRQQNNTLA